MAQINLTCGRAAHVDEQDVSTVAPYSWRSERNRRTRYAVAWLRVSGKQVKIYMHRLILGSPRGALTDHRDGDGLNNRRVNLRACSHKQNGANSKARGQGSSKFKGVSWNRQARKWRAQIWVAGKRVMLIATDDEAEAARAYDSAARDLYGEFALLNFPSATESGP